MLKRLIHFLNQPYPDKDEVRDMVRGALASGFIVGCVLYVLKPFDLNMASRNAWFYVLMFGSISSAVSLVFDIFVRFVLGIRRDTEQWSLWKWLVTVSLLIVCIALANYAFIAGMITHKFSLSIFFQVLYVTALVGVFPTAIFGGINLVRNLKANQRIAAGIHPHHDDICQEQIIELPINKSSRVFKVNASSILCVEAMQNYVRIYYSSGDTIREEMLRNTIKAIEIALAGTNLKRCHRSYLVNSTKIISVSGNAQGLKLELDGLKDAIIPVSRKYIDSFRQLMA